MCTSSCSSQQNFPCELAHFAVGLCNGWISSWASLYAALLVSRAIRTHAKASEPAVQAVNAAQAAAAAAIRNASKERRAAVWLLCTSFALALSAANGIALTSEPDSTQVWALIVAMGSLLVAGLVILQETMPIPPPALGLLLALWWIQGIAIR